MEGKWMRRMDRWWWWIEICMSRNTGRKKCRAKEEGRKDSTKEMRWEFYLVTSPNTTAYNNLLHSWPSENRDFIYIITSRDIGVRMRRGRMSKCRRKIGLMTYGVQKPKKGKTRSAEQRRMCFTRRKVLMLGILFSSIRSRKAFSWLLQYSPYTEKLSFCKKWEKTQVRIVDQGRNNIFQ